MSGQTLFERLFGPIFVRGEKEHAYTEHLFGGEGSTGNVCDLASEEGPWHAGHDADPVAALSVGRGRSAVGEPAQSDEGCAKDGMGWCFVGDCRDEADTAGVMIEALVNKRSRRGDGRGDLVPHGVPRR